jgi:hypothetical protein
LVLEVLKGGYHFLRIVPPPEEPPLRPDPEEPPDLLDPDEPPLRDGADELRGAERGAEPTEDPPRELDEGVRDGEIL